MEKLVATLRAAETKDECLVDHVFLNEEDCHIPLLLKEPTGYVLPSGWEEMQVRGMRKISDPVQNLCDDLTSLLKNERRIRYMNGHGESHDFFPPTCDFCEHWQVNLAWTCKVCNKVMCQECFEETSEEVVEEHNSSVERWLERKDALEACRVHGLKPRPSLSVFCDGCSDILSTPRFSSRELDYCPSCYKNLSKEEQSELQAISFDDLDLGMGSLLHWLPLFEDDEGGQLLYNAAVDSPQQGQWALHTIDDHGREGYQVVADDFACLKREIEGRSGPDTAVVGGLVQGGLINMFAHDRGIPIYYG